MNKIEYLNELYEKEHITFEYRYKTLFINKPIKVKEFKRIKRTLNILNINCGNIVIGKPRFRW